ncbi:MAG: heavy-metal-associated domain-containing protein [Nesterenkonia sp.]|uniref:heavy-metal-associated domain-containing protein n=1 Tax=Nesterenkonia marinintestina TaxID=2979865 RepID=UPI0021BF3F3E|nr:heavy-metal-associated domain-containing protein [Nesterenkonia sp. GX14115]MDO5493002.1 heavy-metal-associated domain-containing protein [Nesterenkonia sp.]
MTETREYSVDGMSCAHCESAVTEEVSALPEVEGIDVDVAAGSLRVSGPAERLDDDAVVAAVDEAGYTAVRAA